MVLWVPRYVLGYETPRGVAAIATSVGVVPVEQVDPSYSCKSYIKNTKCLLTQGTYHLHTGKP